MLDPPSAACPAPRTPVLRSFAFGTAGALRVALASLSGSTVDLQETCPMGHVAFPVSCSPPRQLRR